jgi:hypothetical protein
VKVNEDQAGQSQGRTSHSHPPLHPPAEYEVVDIREDGSVKTERAEVPSLDHSGDGGDVRLVYLLYLFVALLMITYALCL